MKEQFDFWQHIARCAAVLLEDGRYGTFINYRKAIASLRAFCREDRRYRRYESRLPFDKFDRAMIVSYNCHMQDGGLSRNSRSFYNRVLRAAYNKAVEEGLTEDGNPFREVYTGIDRTRKRAARVDDIARIRCFRCEGRLALARDIFLFSFYTRGMAFVDIAYLKRSDIRYGYIYYERRKTGTPMRVRIEPELKEILEKYRTDSTADGYVFPVLGDAVGGEAYSRYLTALSEYNSLLYLLAEKAKCKAHLSSYVARHSWAAAARDTDAPISVISESLGHGSEKTTRIYLDSIDNSKIDVLNSSVIGKTKKFGSSLEPNLSPFSAAKVA